MRRLTYRHLGPEKCQTIVNEGFLRNANEIGSKAARQSLIEISQVSGNADYLLKAIKMGNTREEKKIST